MGYTANTNIDLVLYDPGDDPTILEKTIHNNAIVLFDNDSGTSLEVFENLYIKPNKLIPKLVCERGGKGGGGTEEIIQIISDTLLNPNNSLYLPTIVVNGFITKIAVDGTIQVLKTLFHKFKSVHRRKRVKIMYFAEETTSFFEFPSETNEAEFEKGIKAIPDTINSSARAKYFTRSLKKGLWIEEEIGD